jgi:5-methyltetrahydrofolate corrinoid/iron sulfur protein methyltransferase
MPEIVDLIYKVMDGEITDFSSLAKKELDYAKTTKVLMGDMLYSHAWLEM